MCGHDVATAGSRTTELCRSALGHADQSHATGAGSKHLDGLPFFRNTKFTIRLTERARATKGGARARVLGESSGWMPRAFRKEVASAAHWIQVHRGGVDPRGTSDRHMDSLVHVWLTNERRRSLHVARDGLPAARAAPRKSDGGHLRVRVVGRAGNPLPCARLQVAMPNGQSPTSWDESGPQVQRMDDFTDHRGRRLYRHVAPGAVAVRAAWNRMSGRYLLVSYCFSR